MRRARRRRWRWTRASWIVTALAWVLVTPQRAAWADAPAPSRAEYRQIQERLQSGWNTWNTRSVTSHVLLPSGLALNLAFKQEWWLEEGYLRETLIGRWGEDAEQVRPGLHAYDGRYTRLDLRWAELDATIESGHDGDDLVILITPRGEPRMPVKLVIEAALLWNRSGNLERSGDRLIADLPGAHVGVSTTSPVVEDYYVQADSPYLVVVIDEPIGISTGRDRDVEEIRNILERQEADLRSEAEPYGDLAEAYLAVQAGIAWNLIYEPKYDRVVSTVGRLWNEEYGGYCLFGWDNFFLAYMTGLASRDLAFANAIEHLRGATDEGFIPNDNRGNGSKSFDRSQPPVGGIMVKEIYKTYPERWFLEEAFDPLLAWNRWWPTRRLNEGLLSYGSHITKNPFKEPAVHSKRTAGYESGMDDSPMYEDVPFNPDKNTLELQDVGLTSLYLADCKALAEMAELLGRDAERRELLERVDRFAGAMESLWSEEVGLYLNRRTDRNEPSMRLSPTLFYPLLAGLPDHERAARILNEHFENPEEFGGEWILPSTARSDPSFPKQRYWKGAIWPPLNFLSYLSLRQQGFDEAAAHLSERSLTLFLNEWRRKGYVSENYSSITGTGDDERLSSDRFHSWGALFGMISLIEAGYMPAPAAPLRPASSPD